MLLNSDLLDQLAIKTDAKMIFLVMDGLAHGGAGEGRE